MKVLATPLWIDDLIEFQETVLPNSISEMSIAQALYKLEASKDIPSIELIEYDGDPLTYVEFFERFRLHIHDKPHLNDNVRMVQLKMHLTSRASRAVSGLGSQGKMYATALKTLKEQFGTPSAIARAHIKGAVSHFTQILFLYFLAILRISCRFSLVKAHKLHYFYLLLYARATDVRWNRCNSNGYIPPRFLHSPCFKYIVHRINSLALIFV